MGLLCQEWACEQCAEVEDDDEENFESFVPIRMYFFLIKIESQDVSLGGHLTTSRVITCFDKIKMFYNISGFNLFLQRAQHPIATRPVQLPRIVSMCFLNSLLC